MAGYGGTTWGNEKEPKKKSLPRNYGGATYKGQPSKPYSKGKNYGGTTYKDQPEEESSKSKNYGGTTYKSQTPASQNNIGALLSSLTDKMIGVGRAKQNQIADAIKNAQKNQGSSAAPSYPTFGRDLKSYLDAMGVGGSGSGGGMSSINTNFGKTLQDYLSQKQYDPMEWAKEQLQAHDQFDTKMEHRGDIGGKALGTIYSQLGDEIGGLGKSSAEGYQTAIDEGTARNESAATARQGAYENQRVADDVRRKLLMGEDAQTGVSDAQANVDTSFGADTQSNTARGSNAVDALASRQMNQQDMYGQLESAAGFRGGEAQQALMADVNEALTQNAGNRVNTIANAKNESRNAATQHFGSDYGQFSDGVNLQMQQQQQRQQQEQMNQQLAIQQYQADYGQFRDNADFENQLSQQQYSQYADQQNRMAQQNQAPKGTKLDEIFNSQMAQGIPPAVQQMIMSTMTAHKSNPAGPTIDPMKELMPKLQAMGYDLNDPQNANASALIYQMLNM